MIPIQNVKTLSNPCKNLAFKCTHLRFKLKFTLEGTERVSTSEIAEIRA